MSQQGGKEKPPRTKGSTMDSKQARKLVEKYNRLTRELKQPIEAGKGDSSSALYLSGKCDGISFAVRAAGCSLVIDEDGYATSVAIGL